MRNRRSGLDDDADDLAQVQQGDVGREKLLGHDHNPRRHVAKRRDAHVLDVEYVAQQAMVDVLHVEQLRLEDIGLHRHEFLFEAADAVGDNIFRIGLVLRYVASDAGEKARVGEDLDLNLENVRDVGKVVPARRLQHAELFYAFLMRRFDPLKLRVDIVNRESPFLERGEVDLREMVRRADADSRRDGRTRELQVGRGLSKDGRHGLSYARSRRTAASNSSMSNGLVKYSSAFRMSFPIILSRAVSLAVSMMIRTASWYRSRTCLHTSQPSIS